uniref:C-type lectin domain-containing protein n=1 Tax=Varanus komodoensis TaxID=61221 RepID=A0A8D2LKB5_VARKO
MILLQDVLCCFSVLNAVLIWNYKPLQILVLDSGWIGYEGKCYFFSEEEGNWTHGQNFCSSHGSFLARIETESEKVFLLRYKGRADHWIGLSKDQSEAWKWADGAEFRNTVAMEGEGADCACLSTDTAIVSRCHIPRHWICSHPGAAKHRYPLGE